MATLPTGCTVLEASSLVHVIYCARRARRYGGIEAMINAGRLFHFDRTDIAQTLLEHKHGPRMTLTECFNDMFPGETTVKGSHQGHKPKPSCFQRSIPLLATFGQSTETPLMDFVLPFCPLLYKAVLKTFLTYKGIVIRTREEVASTELTTEA